MGRTNIVLADDLVTEGLQLSGSKTKRELVDRALRAYVSWLKKRQLRALRGAVDYYYDYDHMELRRGEVEGA